MTAIVIKTVDYLEQIRAIQSIRKQVFQQEQGVAPELEFDGLDKTAIHLLAYLENKPVGTARIREIDGKTVKIERLAVLTIVRRRGIGKQLMEEAIKTIVERNYQIIIVHAQEYIKNLYQQLGFEQVGNVFEEANILHVKMIKKITNNI